MTDKKQTVELIEKLRNLAEFARAANGNHARSVHPNTVADGFEKAADTIEALTRQAKVSDEPCRKCNGERWVHENAGPKVPCSLCVSREELAKLQVSDDGPIVECKMPNCKEPAFRLGACRDHWNWLNGRRSPAPSRVSDDAVVERGDLIKRLLVEADRYERGRGAPMARLLREAVAALSATNSEAVSELTSAADELTRWYGPFNPTKHPPEINGAWLRLTDALAKLGSRAPEDTP
jgi:hypothetical protein